MCSVPLSTSVTTLVVSHAGMRMTASVTATTAAMVTAWLPSSARFDATLLALAR